MTVESEILPGVHPEKEVLLRNSFLYRTKVIPQGERIKLCIQCGTCTGSCPLSYAMDITPRKLIALFRAGDMESILRSKSIWICASCYTCQTRCPSLIKVTDILYALKRTAMEKKLFNKNIPTYALSYSFMKCIYKYGRLNEAQLILRFYLRTGLWKIINLIPLGIKLITKRRIKLTSEKIKAINDLRKIIKKAETFELPPEKEELAYIPEAVGYKAVS
ncbi:4Fe-4S dicluster domain-containing protein [Rosettibacter firmus]|uniref:4Fe-4S dicluster domain-containing protein n=1 Tax=Rosettibacter firmus TaxID=3111522 RepID=UPI00336C1D43